ncbi:MAG: tRNA epoxyqueuosine(34) reductase QueG [Verrucomicrobia bacterium]|nr:tRNA epoxyqueuosine(34) reductase QueG [Verrucomicrobiota bacterium]
MKEQVRQRALELGFDDCRVTTAAAPENGQRFRDWLAAHWHGEMAYLQRNAPKRLDPQQVLAGARSIITLAASYARVGDEAPRVSDPQREDRTAAANDGSGSGEAPARGMAGVVARYARFADYHDVLGERLRALTEFVNRIGGAGTRSLWYVDTGPLLERELAQRAGLGFIGKHTNLISRQLGNWFLLAEIVTTLELEPDAPEKNRCGSCTRCLSACPTQAIRAPFQLDARRCISYLTIELKGAIPIEWRGAIGNRIFGCDDCLAACPWNRFARAGRLMGEHARGELAEVDLVAWLALDEAGFRERFRETPLWRIKRRGLRRNVCVALGNTGDARALPALQQAAHDAEPLITEHARWAIEQIEGRQRTPGGVSEP